MAMRQIFAVFAAVCCLNACAANDVGRSAGVEHNVLEFHERASVRLENDTLHAVLMVKERHASREAASHAASRHLSALQQRIRNESAVEAEWGNRSVYPIHDAQSRITQWEDSSEIRLKSSDFAALNRLLADSQSHAMVASLTFGVSPQARSRAIEQASVQLLQQVRHRAGFLSQQMGFGDYRLLLLELTDSFESSAPPMAYAAEVSAKAADFAPAPALAGHQEISQTARVRVQMQR